MMSKPVIVLLAIVFILTNAATASDPTTTGQWKQKIQLVWDEPSRQLTRKILRVWDGQPELGLEFYWEPDGSSLPQVTEVVEGRGVLTWRRAGTPNYDPRSAVMIYRGEMANGRPHGWGRLELANGTAYEGDWVGGLMHGVGHLRHENGDEYVGEFVAGRFHGRGKHIAANGDVYEGPFTEGQRNGRGTLTPLGGTSRVTSWVNGAEVLDQPVLIQDKPGSPSDVTFAITTDARKNAQAKRAVKDFSEHVITYKHQVRDGSLMIVPEDEQLLRIWKQRAPLYQVYRKQLAPDYASTLYDAPAYVKINISSPKGNASLKSLSLDIAESHTDTQPFLGVLNSRYDDKCGGNQDLPYDPTYVFVNTGWGALADARIKFRFLRPNSAGGSGEFEQTVGSFDQFIRISSEASLLALGVDVNQLKTQTFECTSLKEIKACQQKSLQQLKLGRLESHVYFPSGDGAEFLITDIDGAIEYQWRDSTGAMQRTSSPFRTSIVLTAIKVDIPAECGAGAPELPNAGVPLLELPAEKNRYRLSYPLKATVGLTNQGREFILGLFATKSSHHSLRFVAELADGKKIASPVVQFTYVRPRAMSDYDVMYPDTKDGR
jgi:hypothetical protein